MRFSTEQLATGIRRTAWTISGVVCLLVFGLVVKFELDAGGGFRLSHIMMAIGFVMVWVMLAALVWTVLQMATGPVVHAMNVRQKRRLLTGLGGWPTEAPRATDALIDHWLNTSKRVRTIRRVRHGLILGMVATPIAVLISLGRARVASDTIAWLGPVAIVALWMLHSIGINWLNRRQRNLAPNLSHHLVKSGIPAAALKSLGLDRDGTVVRASADIPLSMTVLPVSTRTLEAARSSDRTGDVAFDDASLVELPERTWAPMQAWLTPDVRQMLMPLLAHGGQMGFGRVEATFEHTDPNAVHDLVAGVFAITEVKRLLDARYLMGARERAIDAMRQARTDAERDALVYGIRRSTQRSDAEVIATHIATDLRGYPRLRALDIVGQRPIRIDLALAIDDDTGEDPAVRGAALGAAIQQGSQQALLRMRGAIAAGDAWRVVGAVSACDQALATDAADAVRDDLAASVLPAPIVALVLIQWMPAGVRLDDELAHAIRTTTAAPGSAVAMAAQRLAEVEDPVFAAAGAQLVATIAASQQGALALTVADSGAGALAVTSAIDADASDHEHHVDTDATVSARR